MPIPIHLNKGDGNIDYFNLLHLNNEPISNNLLKKEAIANDEEADLLFRLWDGCKIINKSDETNISYEVPNNIEQKDVLRLKTAGLIYGGDKDIKFTSKAVSIIKTFVLSEANNFLKRSVKKPYSIILAEQKSPKRKSNLALAVTAASQKDVGNIDIRDNKGNIKNGPEDNQKWIYNKRLYNTQIDNKGKKHHKEYTIRIYESGDGKYELWCFSGPMNQTQKIQPKGKWMSLDLAKKRANDILDYRKDREYKEYYNQAELINQTLPGIQGTEGATIKNIPQQPTAPAPPKQKWVIKPTPKIEKKPEEKTIQELVKTPTTKPDLTREEIDKIVNSDYDFLKVADVIKSKNFTLDDFKKILDKIHKITDQKDREDNTDMVIQILMNHRPDIKKAFVDEYLKEKKETEEKERKMKEEEEKEQQDLREAEQFQNIWGDITDEGGEIPKESKSKNILHKNSNNKLNWYVRARRARGLKNG